MIHIYQIHFMLLTIGQKTSIYLKEEIEKIDIDEKNSHLWIWIY